MPKAIAVFLMLLFFGINLSLAKSTSSFLKDKIEIGGGFTAGFANDLLTLGIAPSVGIRLIPQLYFGIGLSYEYNYQFVEPKSHVNVFGISFLSRYTVFKGLYLQAELDTYSSFYGDKYGNKDQAFERHLLLGGGYQVQLSERMYAYTSILWDAFHKDYPYSTNPVIQVGVGYLF